MNTWLDPEKITQFLTISTRNLGEDVMSALAEARNNALKKQSARSPVSALAAGRWTHGLLLPHTAQQLAGTALLAIMIVIGATFLQHSQDQQTGDIDVAILTDDLPIEVFVD